VCGVSTAVTITLSQDVWSLPPSLASFTILSVSVLIGGKCDRYAKDFRSDEVNARRRRIISLLPKKVRVAIRLREALSWYRAAGTDSPPEDRVRAPED